MEMPREYSDHPLCKQVGKSMSSLKLRGDWEGGIGCCSCVDGRRAAGS